MNEQTDIREMLESAKQAGISIEAIAENAGVNQSTLRRWLSHSHNPHPSTLRLVRASIKDMLDR